MNDLQEPDTQKIQLTIAINFVSSKNIDEECVMHLKSDNIEVAVRDKTDDVFKETFEPLLSGYQIGLETSMRNSKFIFESVYFLRYKCHGINLKRVGSYIDLLIE